METKSIKNIIRNIAIRHLSQERYRKFALFYNKIAARFKEQNIRKPLDNIIDCGLPLIYISQPPRSGGTMLRNLFDGHNECHVFPFELAWQKNGFNWDDSLENITNSKQAYELLYGRWIDHAIVNGIQKKYPFFFNRTLQKKLFFRHLATDSNQKRHWLDRYLTSFFNAWVDYQGLYGLNKKFCVAFCPHNIRSMKETAGFFRYYPDGFRIHVVRNPLAWWASIKEYGSSKKDLDRYLRHWLESVKIGLQAVELYPRRYILVSFDTLIEDVEMSLRKICERLDLRFDNKMLFPTINNMPAISNTSFGEGQRGIDKSVLEKWKLILTPAETDKVKARTDEIYEKILSKCINNL